MLKSRMRIAEKDSDVERNTTVVMSSVPDPDPPDPHVFGPPGSGSFYHQAKIVRKILIPIVL
jgi:hypothetical protein